ncbi:restriction endonuclease subunit S [Clostridium thermobutyricum]|uniref:restriction endonuclease subunit S n=1 Tax=Clostridium thermobutyricum TaxID=29372 RepID=UPI003F527DA3
MEKRNVPKLRFKGFEDEWKENKIGDIFRVFAGGDINKKNFSDIKNDEFKYPVYSNTLINEGIQGYSNIYRFNSETITVTGRGVNVGVAKARFCKYYPIVRLLSLIPTQEVNVKFFEEVINNTNIFIESTGVPQLTSPQIAKVKVSSPSLEEQIKIANFLSSVDNIIEEQEGKVKDLEQYKKGMMQKIFKQEVRFKDENGDNYSEWTERKLDYCLKLSEKIKADEIDRNKLLSVKLHLQGIKVNTNTETLSIGSTIYYKRFKNQFIYGKQNFFNGSFGIVPDEFDGYLSSGDIPSLDFISENIIPKFLIYYLGRKSFYKRTENLASGTGSKRIHESTLLDIKIKIPCIEEQTKIASFLSNIDNIIEEEKKKLEDLKLWKKGLLQQMFV